MKLVYIHPYLGILCNNYFAIEPFIAHEFGSTWYRLQVTEQTEEINELGFTESVGQSELEYPLDVMLFGIRLLKAGQFESGKAYRFFMRGWFNVTDPNSKMKDSDWFGVRDGSLTSLYKFSYTESRSELIWLGGETGIEVSNYSLFGHSVSYGFKIESDASYHKMFGVKGWQELPGTERIEFDELRNKVVLTYKLFYFEPSVYINVKLLKTQMLNWSVLFSFSPLTIAYDIDNHVLRNKKAETTAFGIGLGIVSELSYKVAKNAFLIGEYRLRYIRTEGKMDQKFYGDDPSFEGDETGLEINNIDNIIALFTNQISLGLRWYF